MTTDVVGGVWDYTAALARAFEAEGHSLFIATIGRPEDDQLATLPEGVAVESRDHPLEWTPASTSELRVTAEWLARLSLIWRAQVVHLSQMTYTGLARFAAPTVVVVHSDVLSWFAEVRGTPAPSEWAAYADGVRRGLRTATATVAVSRSQAAMTNRHYGPVDIRVIHNGSRGSGGEPRPRTQALLLTTGRAWDDGKGHAVLDRALSLISDPRPPAHLVGSLEGPAGQRFSAERLICDGHLVPAAVQEWMRLATIYVAPSLYEPFGLAPVEAALAGCALVLSDIDTFRELWDGAAIFFEKGSPQELASALMALLEEPDKVDHLAVKARDRASSRFTVERCAAEYLSLYTELAQQTTSAIASAN